MIKRKKSLKEVFEINENHILTNLEKESLYRNIIKHGKQTQIRALFWKISGIAAILVIGLLLFTKNIKVDGALDIKEYANISQKIINKSDTVKIVSNHLKGDILSQLKINESTIQVDSSFTTGKNKYVTIYVPYGKRLDFNLPDGSTVWLNSGSYLTFNNEINGKDREVYLNGEGFFNVKQTGHRFIVHTKSNDIEVLGTSFNTTSYEDENLFAVELLTGEVKLSSNEHKYNSFKMNPGENISINTLTNKLFKSSRKEDIEILWTKKQLSLKNTALGDILKKMERIYNVNIYAEKEIMAMNINYSGRLNVDVDVVTSLNSIYELNNYNINLKEKEVYITKK